MNEILSFSQLEILVMLLIGGGVAMFLAGLATPLFRSHGADMRGVRREKPMMPVGIGLCILGVVLSLSWDIL
jgi:hypothetical protein